MGAIPKQRSDGHCEVLLIDPGSVRGEVNEPIGIASLASYASNRLAGRISIQQWFVPYDGEPIHENIRRADVVGIATRIGSLEHVDKIASTISDIDTGSRPLLVLGDLLATYATEELLGIFPESICVVGEGEQAFSDILEYFIAHRGERSSFIQAIGQSDVPNLAFLDHGRLRRTTRKNIDLTCAPQPERVHLAAIREYQGIARVESSRGCSWGRCNFCAIPHKYSGDRNRRPLPVERVVEELAELSESGIRSPYFTDEDFIGRDADDMLRLVKEISKAKHVGRISRDLTFYISSSVSSIVRRCGQERPSGLDLLRELKSVGLREVFLGIESGARDQMKRFGKSARAEDGLIAIRILKKLGLVLDVGFIMFDPEMTLPELAANLMFIRDSGIWKHDSRLTKKLRVIPNTPLASTYRERDLLSGSLDINNLEYPHRWADPQVEAVHEAFTVWEERYLVQLNEMQAATRGELPDEDTRRLRKLRLGILRGQDLDVLDTMVRAVASGQDPAYLDLSDIERRRDTACGRWSCG